MTLFDGSPWTNDDSHLLVKKIINFMKGYISLDITWFLMLVNVTYASFKIKVTFSMNELCRVVEFCLPLCITLT